MSDARNGKRGAASAFPAASQSCWRVTEIVLSPDRLAELRGFELEFPALGSEGSSHVLDITGWVVGRSMPAASLEVTYRDEVLRVIPVSGAREDVAALFPDMDGADCKFSSSVGLLGLAPESELCLRVVLGDTSVVPVGSIRLIRRFVHLHVEPTIQPLMSTSLGRSGSTWMMKLLAAHPEVVAHDEYPYEENYALYWLHMVKVLAEPTNRIQSIDHSFQHNLWKTGHNPYSANLIDPVLRDWFGRTYVERLVAFAQNNIEDWYRTLAWRKADAVGEGDRPPPRLFAEKLGPTPVYQDLVWELYPNAKEVFIVRDFRDMICSVFAFDKARGYFGFGRQEGSSDEEYIRQMRLPALNFRDAWLTRQEGAHLLRYEDLVLRPRETISLLLDYLGLARSEALIDRMIAAGSALAPAAATDPSAVRLHRTSTDLGASVGRWRDDLDDCLKASCQEAFGDLLEEFGYTEAGTSFAGSSALSADR